MISSRDFIEEIKSNLPESGNATMVLALPDGVRYLSLSREEVLAFQAQHKKLRKRWMRAATSVAVASALVAALCTSISIKQGNVINHLSTEVSEVTKELDNTMSAINAFPFIETTPHNKSNVGKVLALSDVISLQDESFRFFVQYTRALSENRIVQLESALESLDIKNSQMGEPAAQTMATGGISTANNILSVMNHYLEDNLIEKIERHSELLELKSSLPLLKPLSNARVSSRFGLRNDPITRAREVHQGMDLVSYSHPDALATADGLVEFAGWDSNGYGKMVIIRHSDEIRTLYAHLSEININAGQAVTAGDVIGLMGNTGRSTASHLHYEVRVNDNRVNPAIFFGIGDNVQ